MGHCQGWKTGRTSSWERKWVSLCQADSLENRADSSMCTCTVLRWVAEGKIPWGFWPPGSSVSSDDGIWLKDGVRQHAWDELEMDDDEDGEEGSEDSESEEVSSEEGDTKARIMVALGESDDEDEEKPAVRGGNLGRFGALRIE
jgi:hypothetical protein